MRHTSTTSGPVTTWSPVSRKSTGDSAVNGRVLHSRAEIADAVASALRQQPIADMHTHLYPPAFGTPALHGNGRHDVNGLMLWGIDELLTYHYLIAEVFRAVPASQMPYETFWKMDKARQAQHIWQHLFLDRTPVSEAARGVVTTLTLLGLDPAEKNLQRYRNWYAQQKPDDFTELVMQRSGVESITMTNNIFDQNECRFWLNDHVASSAFVADGRFRAVVRLDPMLSDWAAASRVLQAWGYDATPEQSSESAEAGRQFLRDWIDRTSAIYCAASLPPQFCFPEDSTDTWVMRQIVLPVCAERGLALALMIGARRAVNPALRDAGDSTGATSLLSVENLCCSYPDQKFLVTLLARENQHELAVTARKFSNLMIFGCWWFLNTPSLIDEITRMRMELLGLSFIPQHSDARVLDQLLYKWDHSRRVMAKVLTDVYGNLLEAGWPMSTRDIEQDVQRLLKDNFHDFLSN